ncbi:MAG: helix-turn-helix domain-containing protein [Actinomycetota bacterium]
MKIAKSIVSKAAPTDVAKADKNSVARANASRPLEQYLGTAIRDLRLRNRLTIADIAYRAGISKGMLSKIENGQTSTSLDTLSQIANALGVTLSNLFRDFNTPYGGAQLVKKGEGMEVVRAGSKKGHTYNLLAFNQGPRKIFDPFLVTINDKSEVFPSFEHPGTEFIYLLEGKIKYRHGQQTYILLPGDSLSFKGKVPHGPEQLIKLPIKMLAIIIYHGDEEQDLR